MKCALCSGDIERVSQEGEFPELWSHSYPMYGCYTAEPLSLETLERNEPQKKYLLSMLARNVYFYPHSLWLKAVEAEILDRGLVTRNGIEHIYINLLVEKALMDSVIRS